MSERHDPETGRPDGGDEERTSARSPRAASRTLDGSLGNEALPRRVRCPFCGGRETEQFAAFGSAVSTSQYYCRPCRSVFEYMKPRRDP